ncbi:pyridoxamine 5'-phosphate oxidase [Hypomontagnella submonticulosa]|nr:pyridoxamine 5'-phosphate oxidase [Hypomontagnella submonticulosa]
MSSFSNTNTGDKPSGPYYNKNIDTDATLKEKVEALAKFVSSCKFGMMTTRDATTGKLVSRCMAVAGKEGGDIDLTFTTNTESHKTDELKADKHTNISFCDSSGQWASFAGDASIETNRDIVKKYYSPTLKAWLGDLGDGVHDGSANDPRIGVLKVRTSSVTYAITDKSIIGRAAEVAKGTMTGEPARVNKLREISEKEVQQWRATASKEA